VIVLPLSVIEGTEGLISRPHFRASKPLRCEFTSADSDHFFSHSLGRVPDGFLVVGREGGFVVYNGSEEWTDSMIVLRATDVGIAFVVVV
jgi:hypothetical protein